MKQAKSDLLQGTLDLLILRILASGDMHARVLQHGSPVSDTMYF
jgi:hypothetical protein